MKRLLLTAAFAGAWAGPVAADRDAFVEANLLAIFYHELGHAVIDLMEVPIFGQEEDAADVMSVLLIDWLFQEEDAQSIAYDSAFGHITDPEGEAEVAYWDLHGPDEQRFYNHVCLFYGANPDEREELAQDLGLPEERAETCPEEYELAADSWGGVFAEMEDLQSGVPMVFRAGDEPFLNALLEQEVTLMNEQLSLPQELVVSVEPCGETNAFYHPAEVEVTLCSELVAHLEQLYDTLR